MQDKMARRGEKHTKCKLFRGTHEFNLPETRVSFNERYLVMFFYLPDANTDLHLSCKKLYEKEYSLLARHHHLLSSHRHHLSRQHDFSSHIIGTAINEPSFGHMTSTDTYVVA